MLYPFDIFLQSGIIKTLFIFMYLPQKLRRFPRKMSAWAGRVVSCTEMYRYGPRVTFCPSLWNTIAIIIMKSGFIRKEADLICLFGSLREKRAKARLTGWTLDRSKSWANSEAAHWPTLLRLVFSLAKVFSLFKASRQSHCETQYWVSPKQGNNR